MNWVRLANGAWVNTAELRFITRRGELRFTGLSGADSSVDLGDADLAVVMAAIVNPGGVAGIHADWLEQHGHTDAAAALRKEFAGGQ